MNYLYFFENYEHNLNLETIYNRYFDNLVSYLQSHFKISRDKSEDTIQDVFIKIKDNLHKYKGTGSLEGWLKTISRNLYLDNCRSDQKKKLNFTQDISRFSDVEEEQNFDEDENKDDKNKELIKKAIEDLPPKYQKIFKMYYLDGIKHKEISNLLKISQSTSRTNLMKAKNKVKNYLTKSYESKRIKSFQEFYIF